MADYDGYLVPIKSRQANRRPMPEEPPSYYEPVQQADSRWDRTPSTPPVGCKAHLCKHRVGVGVALIAVVLAAVIGYIVYREAIAPALTMTSSTDHVTGATTSIGGKFTTASAVVPALTMTSSTDHVTGATTSIGEKFTTASAVAPALTMTSSTDHVRGATTSLRRKENDGKFTTASAVAPALTMTSSTDRVTEATRNIDGKFTAESGCPRIVSRAEWGARRPRYTNPISRPVPRYFVHHTAGASAGASCTTQASCSAVVRGVQNNHMDSPDKRWSDIGYNFIVGEDGNVYEGRGWNYRGGNSPRYNSQAYGVSIIGNYMTRNPNAAALQAIQQLISCGISLGKLRASYTLHGHRDGRCTDCPGNALYNTIQSWPHYGGRLPGSCNPRG